MNVALVVTAISAISPSLLNTSKLLRDGSEAADVENPNTKFELKTFTVPEKNSVVLPAPT